ncbi:serine hydrolase [Salinibacter altiplanensis]|uniref:serine hydrolase n=1 Tax=Salinibacter altiplanensis TaxID=1803181 RepID=UPI001319C66C|nr:serine hydrolase [Salinibacter altiplanensis]
MKSASPVEHAVPTVLRRCCWLVGLCLVVGVGGLSEETAPPQTPSTEAESDSISALPLSESPLSKQTLTACTDSTLQQRLHQEISRSEWTELMEQGNLAIGVVDLSVPADPHYAAVNGHHMLYAASLPKIGILYTAVRQMEYGALRPSPEVRSDLHKMVRVSSNAAATRMIDRVGGLRAVNQTLEHAPASLYDRDRGGGIWVGKRFSSDSRRRPDPLEGLSHAATVHQVARFYTMVATGRLVNRARSAQMLEILSNPGLDHKFVHVLRRRAPEASIYRKSGSWRTWHADSALVWGPERRYVIVALVRDAQGGRVVRELLPMAEAALGLSSPRSNS